MRALFPRTLWWLACLGLFAGSACSSDSGPGTSDSSDTGSAAGSDMVYTPSAGGDEPDPDNGEPANGDEPAEHCVNEHDHEGMSRWVVHEVVYQCYAACHPEDDPVTCLVDCTSINMTGQDLTEYCLGCFAEVLACSYQDLGCTELCAADSDSPACHECTCAQGCFEDFEWCSGLPAFVDCGPPE